MRRPFAAAAAAGLTLGLAFGSLPAFAHDFWIQPSQFQPAVGTVVPVRLFVGPNFEGEPLPRIPQLLSRFVLVPPSGKERDVPGRAGGDPAGVIRVEEPGLQIVGYRSLDSPVSIDGAKFEDYLKEEGLEKIAEIRKKRGDAGKPAREAFSRCAKALLEAGGGDGGADRAIGLTLELVAEKNPYSLPAAGELPVVLRLDGKPLAGALVQALRHGDASVRTSARTDKNGRAVLKLPKTGFWLVKAVDMSPAAAGADAEWQSLWASLTFENGPPNPVGKAP